MDTRIFELAETTLRSLHEAMARVTDGDQIITMLKKADVAIALNENGGVAPALKHAREAFKTTWEALEKPAA
jgi:hypothetical protein